MSKTIEMMKSLPDFIGSDGRDEQEIIQAETALGVSFAKDYREYLKEIGLACFDGYEFTGITDVKRLDVVSVTKEQREESDSDTKSWYVIEEAGIDGIAIWQDSNGNIYQTTYGTHCKKIADSIMEYINM